MPAASPGPGRLSRLARSCQRCSMLIVRTNGMRLCPIKQSDVNDEDRPIVPSAGAAATFFAACGTIIFRAASSIRSTRYIKNENVFFASSLSHSSFISYHTIISEIRNTFVIRFLFLFSILNISRFIAFSVK